MLNMRNPFKHDKSTEGQLPGPNPTGDELAQLRAKAIASDAMLRQQETARQRQEALRHAVAAGRVVVHNSEISGEVPMITPDMKRPVDSVDGVDQADVDPQVPESH